MDYRRMGNMDQHLGNATSTTFLHDLRDLWKSPGSTVLRIEALALVAIALSFLYTAFGSCRRWSNRWIVQKGFLVANVASVSLGTYGIGLMQSTPVKSEMYPIWAVSLLTLFGCVDPITSYSGLDYKSPLSKVIFQLCLYCGYALLMSISAIFSRIINTAVCLLSAITFIKGFHRSLGLVLQSRMRDSIRRYHDEWATPEGVVFTYQNLLNSILLVHLPLDKGKRDDIRMKEIYDKCQDLGDLIPGVHDMCMALSLSHLLQRRLLGPKDETSTFSVGPNVKSIDYNWALKLIEVELAFLYEVNFTSNAFLHYYQAKTSSLWAFASFVGICFVGVAAAICVTVSSRQSISPGPGAGTIVVDTTTADYIITLIILVSLALLQLVQLVPCWTSNWARVNFACDLFMKRRQDTLTRAADPPIAFKAKSLPWCMRFRAFLLNRINWFDRYLWQDMLSQCSLVDMSNKCKLFSSSSRGPRKTSNFVRRLYLKCYYWSGKLGLEYIGQVLWELLGSDTKKGGAVRLDGEVKASIVEFLCQIRSRRIDASWFDEFGAIGIGPEKLPYREFIASHAVQDEFAHCVLQWHIATCYCEVAELEREELNQTQTKAEHTGYSYRATAAAAATACFKKQKAASDKNRRVATKLSNYCAYLMTSAPELLPGPSWRTESLSKFIATEARRWTKGKGARAKMTALGGRNVRGYDFTAGVQLGKRLLSYSDPCPWKLLALFWVRTLVYAAPYGDAEEHVQHLAKGGEFITHLWALLYHVGISEWERGEGSDTETDLRVVEGSSDKLCRSRSF